jgi:hypothetical protein
MSSLASVRQGSKIRSIDPSLSLERTVGLDSEKAFRARTGVRLGLGVPNVVETVHAVQLLAPIVFVPMKGIVLVAVVLKALEFRMIL